MSRRRKRNRGEEKINDTWLLPYADLLTLLLALFIVLFATSSVDLQKFNQMSRVFNGIFLGGTGILDYQNPVEFTDDASSDYPDSGESEQNLEELGLDWEDLEELQAIQNQINEYIRNNQYGNKFTTSLTSEGLLITIHDQVLFDSGKADVRPKDRETAKELAEFLEMYPPRNIIVSGHTDNVPIRNANFESNWELSVMRAVNFMKLLIEYSGLDPQWFSAKGFGEYQPIADNSTPEGRAKNRRVEVLIQPRINTDEKES